MHVSRFNSTRSNGDTTDADVLAAKEAAEEEIDDTTTQAKSQSRKSF
jgi:hypothetical protein